MPLYEYQCESCGHRFEVIQKFSDRPVTECERCAGPVRKLLSSPAIQFKGSGFYITDYVRKGTEGGKSEAASGRKASEAASSGSSDTASSGKSSDSSSSSSGGQAAPKKD